MAATRVHRRGLCALVVLFALTACGGKQSQGEAAALADRVTQAVYADNANSVAGNFDDQLKTQVTRQEVGLLSDKMHALGAYKGLTFLSGDPVKSEFVYRAAFDKGTMNVTVRVDPDGRLGAYRVSPES